MGERSRNFGNLILQPPRMTRDDTQNRAAAAARRHCSERRSRQMEIVAAVPLLKFLGRGRLRLDSLAAPGGVQKLGLDPSLTGGRRWP